MRKLRTPLLAGTAILLATGAAFAATRDSHVVNVTLPNGEIAKIHYSGNVAPQVVLDEGPMVQTAFEDPFVAFDPGAMFGRDVSVSPDVVAFAPSPFADFDRVSALMDLQAQAMMQQAARLQQQIRSGMPVIRNTAAGNAPAGVVEYRYVSTTNGGCTTSMSWSSDGSSAKPRMVKTSSGDCSTAKGPSAAKPLTAVTHKAEPTDQTIPGALRT